MGFWFAEWWPALCWWTLVVRIDGAFWISWLCQFGMRRSWLCNCTALGYGRSQSEEITLCYSPPKKWSSSSLILLSCGSVFLSLPRYQGRCFSACSWVLLCFFMFGVCFFFFCPDCCHLSQIVISISGTQICPLSLSVFHAGFSPFSLKVAVPPPPPPLL